MYTCIHIGIIFNKSTNNTKQKQALVFVQSIYLQTTVLCCAAITICFKEEKKTEFLQQMRQASSGS